MEDIKEKIREMVTQYKRDVKKHRGLAKAFRDTDIKSRHEYYYHDGIADSLDVVIIKLSMIIM